MSTTAKVLSQWQPKTITFRTAEVIAVAEKAGYKASMGEMTPGKPWIVLRYVPSSSLEAGIDFIPVWEGGRVQVDFPPELFRSGMVRYRPRFAWPDGRNQVTSNTQRGVLEALGVRTTEQQAGETVDVWLPRPTAGCLLRQCLSEDIPVLLRRAFQEMLDAVASQTGVKVQAEFGSIEVVLPAPKAQV